MTMIAGRRIRLTAGIFRIHGNYARKFHRSITLTSGFLKSEDEWKKVLTAEQYRICRQKGTEPPWSGEYVHNSASGIYQCVCCGTTLFSSSTKFDSGTGWPSFYAPVGNSDARKPTVEEGDDDQLPVKQTQDLSHGMHRVEVMCNKCDAHLGHVFPDGPLPTGLRYCINSVALSFKQTQQE